MVRAHRFGTRLSLAVGGTKSELLSIGIDERLKGESLPDTSRRLRAREADFHRLGFVGIQLKEVVVGLMAYISEVERKSVLKHRGQESEQGFRRGEQAHGASGLGS